MGTAEGFLVVGSRTVSGVSRKRTVEAFQHCLTGWQPDSCKHIILAGRRSEHLAKDVRAAMSRVHDSSMCMPDHT